MELSLIIYIIIILAVVVLIFKIIKKIMFAIFATIVFVILIFAGVGTLIYMDYKDLSTMNGDINILYGNPDNVQFGLEIPLQNGSVAEENVSTIEVEDINEQYLKKVDDTDNSLYILVSPEVFKEALSGDETYNLMGTEDLTIAGIEINTSLTSEEVITIIESENSTETYVEIIMEKNEIPDIELFGVSSEDVLIKEIEEELGEVELREALFVSVISDLDAEGTSKVLTGFKEEEINVYPEKFSFKFLRWLPIDMLENIFFTEDNETVSN